MSEQAPQQEPRETQGPAASAQPAQPDSPQRPELPAPPENRAVEMGGGGAWEDVVIPVDPSELKETKDE